MTEDRVATRLEVVPGWLADEYGGEYYRREDVDALLASEQPAPPLDVERLREHEPEPGMGNYATWRWDCSCGWYDSDADAQKWWTHVLGSAPSRPEPENDERYLRLSDVSALLDLGAWFDDARALGKLGVDETDGARWLATWIGEKIAALDWFQR